MDKSAQFFLLHLQTLSLYSGPAALNAGSIINVFSSFGLLQSTVKVNGYFTFNNNES